jgi:demethylmenaquinone methyltransferase/2-methoxy-6-polyprenyl-1,4-benzoquinol methylase
VKAYYDARAPEYDDWYLGKGLYADRDRPGWAAELAGLIEAIEALPPARTLDVACGTGFLTRHLHGEIVGIDASERMLAIARERVPSGEFIAADALELPFEDGSFDRLFTGHFYGHLEDEERERFLDEARRVARELVIVDSSIQHSPVDEEFQPRLLNDGSRWEVYKRYFSGSRLAEELGGGQTLFEAHWFVVVRSRA